MPVECVISRTRLNETSSHGTPGSDPHGEHLACELRLSYPPDEPISISFKPLRTVMNYQYRYGTSTTQAVKTLYHDGGWTRYYQGLSAALIQGPVSRFGDTAANVGILALLEGNKYMKNLPTLVKTVFASLAAAGFRMILTPIDTIKTTMQTQGTRGMAILRARVSLSVLVGCIHIDHP